MTDVQRVLRKNSNGAVTPLGGGLSVGRGAECALRLTEGSPSRLHAQLGVDDHQTWVEDLGSTNGTFVNGVRITARTALKHGDALRFDIEEYTYSGGAVDADKTVLRQPAPPVAAPAAAAAATPAQQLPPGWTEGAGQSAGASKTVFKSPQELAEERRRALAAAPAPAAAGQHPSSDVPLLSVVAGASTGARLELRVSGEDKQEWNIGSDATRELCLPVSGVSALHARIVRDGERWKIIDQVSANGTYVNGKRCTMSFLNSGDRVAFGPVECNFTLPNRGGSGGAIAAGDGAPTARGGWSLWRITIAGVVSFVVTLAIIYLLMK